MNQRMMTFNAIATEVREEKLDDRTYLVAPVIAVKVGVMNGELLSADELFSVALEQWCDIPIPVNHPINNGENVSARDVAVIGEEVIGRLYNTFYTADALKGELWIDIEKALALGGEAEEAVRKLRAGEPLEVSTGYLVDLEVVEGKFNGVPYHGIQHNIRPDHIAVLPNSIGACSWSDGCGAGRVNERSTPMRINLREGESAQDRQAAVLAAFVESQETDEEAIWVTDLYEDYAVLSVIDGAVDTFFKAEYKVGKDGIKLGAVSEVKRKVDYVATNEVSPMTQTPCEAQEESKWSRFVTGLMKVFREVDGMNRDEMIATLTERGVDEGLVANTTDEQLEWMVNHSEPAKPDEDEVDPASTETPDEDDDSSDDTPSETTALNESTVIGNTGVTFGEVAAFVANSKLEAAQTRQEIIDSLTANDACDMTPEVLATMSVEALSQLQNHFMPVSFLGRGVPRTNDADAIPVAPAVVLKALS